MNPAMNNPRIGFSVLTTALASALAVNIATGVTPARAASLEPAAGDWQTLFNGKNLEGWSAKIRGHAPGENPLDTFRVEDGKLVVSYDGYENFDERFGHLFYATPYSHYRLELEYRFVGEPIAGTPEWAFRNSGAMLHAQAPDTMPAAQDFPISIEFQFLGGLAPDAERPTGNLCTPGTHVEIDGVFTDAHCINSGSETYHGDQWVRAAVMVSGSEKVVHYIEGKEVLRYGGLTTGGAVVSGHDPDMKPEGQPLSSGYIALQSEGHRIEFRNIRLLNLKGCMNPHAGNYRSWFIADDPQACEY